MARELMNWERKMVRIDCHQLSPIPTMVDPNLHEENGEI